MVHKLQNICGQNNYGDQTPVATSFLKKNESRTIMVSDQVQEALSVIDEITHIDGVEIPYFLTGTKLEDGTIRFDSIMISGGQREGQTAAFDEKTVAKLSEFVAMNRTNPNAVICHGHTHPPHGNFYNEFSIDDLGAYVNFKNNPEFGEIDTIGMVLVDGNYNFVDYDGNDFQTLPNVVCEVEENARYERLPSYSHEGVRTTERVNQQDSQAVTIDYVQRFSEGWDARFNDIVEQSGLNKDVIRQAIINQADALNNTLYRLKTQGKITEQQEADITSAFNVAFNKAFSDFGLQPLTPEDIPALTFSRDYTQRQVASGMTIEQIDQHLASTTAEHPRNDDIVYQIIDAGIALGMTDREIIDAAGELVALDRQFTADRTQDGVGRND